MVVDEVGLVGGWVASWDSFDEDFFWLIPFWKKKKSFLIQWNYLLKFTLSNSSSNFSMQIPANDAHNVPTIVSPTAIWWTKLFSNDCGLSQSSGSGSTSNWK